jgi:tetratricopeptide (TPR) repeat protein
LPGRGQINHGQAANPKAASLGGILPVSASLDLAALRAAAATQLDPDLLFDLGNAQLAARDLTAAIDSYQRCLAARPRFAQAYNNLGSALIEARRFDEAVVALGTALQLAPRYLRPLVNLGKALRELGRLDEAVERLEAALTIEPDYAPALINLGDALIACDQLARAHQVLMRAVALAPGVAMAHASLALCELWQGQRADALMRLKHALALEPNNNRIGMTLGYAMSVIGDWRDAWGYLQAHWQASAQAVWGTQAALLPRWDGALGPDAKYPTRAPLALVADQGFGDTLQFARYGRELARRGIATTLIVQPPLTAILRSSGLFDGVVAAADEALREGARAWFPLMCLPGVFATGPESIPQAAGYLHADPRRVAAWAQRLAGERRFRIGIAWRGNPRAETGMLVGRSLSLAHFESIAGLDAVRLYSLQKGLGTEQLECLPFRDRIVSFDDLDAGPDAFVDSAALIANLDLVVTSDTSLAHLAGALGRPVWICVQKYPDWRWAYAHTWTPWYASARLFRQHRQGDWSGVFADMRRELERTAHQARD